ncbi:MAG: hypothetical protein R2863_05495 [Candidatus Kapaibacterium sp.]
MNPLSIGKSSIVSDGYLTSEDWTSFDNKLDKVFTETIILGDGTVTNH